MTEIRSAAYGPAWATLTSVTDVDRRSGLSWLSGLGFNRAAPEDLLLRLLDCGEDAFLHRGDLPDAVVDAAAVHPTRKVRIGIAETGRLSPAQWEQLIAASPESGLRGLFVQLDEEHREARRLSRGGRGVGRAPHPDAVPPTTPDEIASMASGVPDIDPQSVTTALWWVGALHTNAAAMRQLATSPKLLIRRSVARAPRLPVGPASVGPAPGGPATWSRP
ncbi:hypothetical protein ACIRVF_12125 [Kitasatospora sp. NPDC101157]|uniref:hypothetical protein n=1 Tax=Kitasatospora sp. NPDC101157 TaxID=3364098 RepID=UPI00380CE78A